MNQTFTDEAKHIKDCQNGQLESFGSLYETYVSTIYKFVYYRTMHKETAEDLTSQTFFKAMDKISKFNSEKSSFKTWLLTIAKNTVIDFYRTNKQDAHIDNVWDLDIFDQPSDEKNISELLDSKKTYQKLHSMLNTLPAQTREILLLRFWQDLSWKEIAEVQQLSVSAVKMKASRAIKKMGASFATFLLLLYILTQ